MSSAVSSLDYLTNDIVAGRLNGSLRYASACVVIYDCLLTLPSEIALFWRWEFSGAAALFFATRYFALWELGIASVLPQTIFNPSCSLSGEIAWEAIEVLQYIPYAPPHPLNFAVFSALRVYGVSERRLAIALLVFALSIAPLPANLARIRWFAPYYDVIWGCGNDVSVPPDVALLETIVTRLSLITSDTIVISFIAISAYKRRAICRSIPGNTPSIVMLLFRDGSIYFAAMLLLNCLHLIMTALQINTINTGGFSSVTIFTNPLTAICVWRSLINLRKLNKRITDPTISDLSFCTALPADGASDHATVQRSAEIATDIRLSLSTSRTDPLV